MVELWTMTEIFGQHAFEVIRQMVDEEVSHLRRQYLIFFSPDE